MFKKISVPRRQKLLRYLHHFFVILTQIKMICKSLNVILQFEINVAHSSVTPFDLVTSFNVDSPFYNPSVGYMLLNSVVGTFLSYVTSQCNTDKITDKTPFKIHFSTKFLPTAMGKRHLFMYGYSQLRLRKKLTGIFMYVHQRLIFCAILCFYRKRIYERT